MDLTLFSVLLCLSLALIAIGVFRAEHTELSLIGFFFLFLLATLLIANDVQYVVGIDQNYTYSLVNGTYEVSSISARDIYDTAQLGGGMSHSFGYWLAICSLVGFVAVLLGLRRSQNYE